MVLEMTWKDRLARAGREGGVAALLGRMSDLIEELWSISPTALSYRAGRLFDHLVLEALESSTELHWWELCLDRARAAAAGTPLERDVAESSEALGAALGRLLGPYEDVRLVPITADTVRWTCMLSDTLVPPESYCVAHNAISLAEAHFHPHATFRAIHAGRSPVGFAMLVDDPDKSEYYLWRFMLASPFHGRGLGRKAMDRIVEYVRSRPRASELTLSCDPEGYGPEGFYLKYGFERTGEYDDDEIVMRLKL
jgi:diamine N-acetyltransferase